MPRVGRLQLLRAMGSRHRYVRLRRATMAITFAALLAVPALGLARLDVIGGAHLALGRRVDALTGAAAIAIAVAAFYAITFVLNAALGRVFCGWGCPVGHAARLADERDAAPPARRRARTLAAVAYSLALAAAIAPWWIAPRSLTSPARVAVALALWLAAAALVWLHGRFWRWSFCRRYCPIGLYYSAVQTDHSFAVHFDPARCIDCDACARVCPVELDARALALPVQDLGGLALDGLPGAHHCLVCGDCVRACELVLRKRALARLPLVLGARRELTPPRLRAGAPSPTRAAPSPRPTGRPC
jgi:ferredoxin-type protein NapH